MDRRALLKLLCPICREPQLAKMNCRRACGYQLTYCQKCDRSEDVIAFMQDHAKDCVPVSLPRGYRQFGSQLHAA